MTRKTGPGRHLALVPDPIDEHTTRLITRMRDRYRWSPPTITVQLAVNLFDIFVMRRCLPGAEGTSGAPGRRRDARSGGLIGGA